MALARVRLDRFEVIEVTKGLRRQYGRYCGQRVVVTCISSFGRTVVEAQQLRLTRPISLYRVRAHVVGSGQVHRLKKVVHPMLSLGSKCRRLITQYVPIRLRTEPLIRR